MPLSTRRTAACAVALVLTAFTIVTGTQDRDLGLEVLGPNDGWAAFGDGTTGGAAAAPHQIYVVRTRAELIAALNNGVFSDTAPGNPSHEPKIIYVEGTIDANVDAQNSPLSCEDYYRDGYTLDAFLAEYDPAVWGRDDEPAGPLEDARLASRAEQQRRVRIRIGSNTTLVGVGPDATIKRVHGSTSFRPRNIIIRNLTLRDTYDCFPEWDPTDGSLGSWNSLYDNISIRNAEHVWVDHNTFRNIDTAVLVEHFGVPYEIHDGQLDITNDADLLTVSWNRFLDNDKGGSLVGSSDGATGDRGRLRTTFHHNLYDHIGQRAPRARYGQIHIHNNYYASRTRTTPTAGASASRPRSSPTTTSSRSRRASRRSVHPAIRIEQPSGRHDPRDRHVRERRHRGAQGRPAGRLQRGQRPGPVRQRGLDARPVRRHPRDAGGAGARAAQGRTDGLVGRRAR